MSALTESLLPEKPTDKFRPSKRKRKHQGESYTTLIIHRNSVSCQLLPKLPEQLYHQHPCPFLQNIL